MTIDFDTINRDFITEIHRSGEALTKKWREEGRMSKCRKQCKRWRKTTYAKKAIEIAAKAHTGQVDKGGSPYILHLLRVMMNFCGDSDETRENYWKNVFVTRKHGINHN